MTSLLNLIQQRVFYCQLLYKRTQIHKDHTKVKSRTLNTRPKYQMISNILLIYFQYAAFAVSRLGESSLPIPPFFSDFGSSLLMNLDPMASHLHNNATLNDAKSFQESFSKSWMTSHLHNNATLSDAKSFQETLSKLWMSSHTNAAMLSVNSLLSMGSNPPQSSSSSLSPVSSPSSFLSVPAKCFQV